MLDSYQPNISPRPFERCLEVARRSGARAAVIETRYIDIDYRSEYSYFYSRAFAEVPDSTHRIHFFAAEVNIDGIHDLPPEVRDRYLGYVILRPSPLGRVGRTVLVPPPEMRDCVQAAVRDRVHFFGQELWVEGVPFAQQDARLGRCAQMAAWVCHYTAHLRGDVARHPMADFSILADPNVATGRPVPSQGLTGLQLSNLMREFDLPPIVYQVGHLPVSGQEPPTPPHQPEDDPGTWDTRTIAVVCRYLNSSYPVLVGTREHAFVLVGYRRVSRDNRPWIDFVRHDDQRGPYLWVRNMLRDVDPDTGDQYSPWQILIAPVPEKLWLAPEAAERIGREYLMTYDLLEGAEHLKELSEAGRLTFRTVAMSSALYKSRSGDRGLDSASLRELRLARFSRLIWMVEAVDRDARSNKDPSVLGEVLFDSTSSDLGPNVLAIRVPGALLVQHTDGVISSPLPATSVPVLSAARFQP